MWVSVRRPSPVVESTLTSLQAECKYGPQTIFAKLKGTLSVKRIARGRVVSCQCGGTECLRSKLQRPGTDRGALVPWRGFVILIYLRYR